MAAQSNDRRFGGMPVAARVFWCLVIGLGAVAVPCCLRAEPQPAWWVPIAGLIGGAVVQVVTVSPTLRARRIQVGYTGALVVGLLLVAGPAAGWAAYVGGYGIQVVPRTRAYKARPWFVLLANIFWSPPVLLLGHALVGALGRSLPVLAIAAVLWGVGNVLLLGPLPGMALGRSYVDSTRDFFETVKGLFAQEAILGVILAVLWTADPWATLLVPLFIFANAGTALAVVRTQDLALQAEEKARTMQAQAITDGLTGIPNRRGLVEHTARLLRAGGTHAVLSLDIDRFKSVNDTYGHDIGDAVLRAVCKELRDALRPSDFCARAGGEELVAVLHDVTDPHIALQVAERVRTRVRRAEVPIVPHATISIGAAIWRSGEAYEDAFKRADTALYHAKRAGRDRVCFGPGAGEEAVEVTPLEASRAEPASVDGSVVAAVR